MKKLVAGLLMLATPALALDKDAEENLNTAAVAMAFRNLCEKTSFSERVLKDFYQKTVQTSGLGEDAVLKLIIDKAAEMTVAIENQDRVKFFCSYVRDTFEESKTTDATPEPQVSAEPEAKPSYSETLLKKKGLLFLDSIILGAIGLAIALPFGWIIKKINGRNLNSEAWWWMTWAIGLPFLIRTLIGAS